MNLKSNNINNLITELFLACITEPICVYANRKDKSIVSVKARSREDDWYDKNWNYVFICSVNNDTDAERLRHIIMAKLEELQPRDFPIPTSLRNVVIDREEK